MPNIPISFEIRSANAEIFLKYKKENESDSQAVERLLYERLNLLESFAENAEERNLENIYVRLGYLQKSIATMSALLPYKPPF
jgi:hypothetical protein